MKKGEVTLRVGNEAVHFNLDKSLTQSDVDAENYNVVDNSSPISFEMISDCNLQHSISFESVDYELLHSSLQNRETVKKIQASRKRKFLNKRLVQKGYFEGISQSSEICIFRTRTRETSNHIS